MTTINEATVSAPVASNNGTSPKSPAKPKAKSPAKSVKKAAVKAKPAPKAKVERDPVKESRCMCGCGGWTKSKFVPGHDARLKGILMRAEADGGMNAKQKALVADLGWEKIIDAKATANLAASAKKAGITVPQLHVLRALSKAPNGLTRPQIAEKVKVTMSMTDHLGPVFVEDNAGVEKRNGFATLVGLKFVSCKMEDDNGRDSVRCTITAPGKRALEKAAK